MLLCRTACLTGLRCVRQPVLPVYVVSDSLSYRFALCPTACLTGLRCVPAACLTGLRCVRQPVLPVYPTDLKITG